ncbi:MAG: hypothetical protein WCO30_00350 [bacterium]
MEKTTQDIDVKVIKRQKILNRWFYIIFFLLVSGSVGFTYYRIVVIKDYQIIAETSCNPKVGDGSCFVRSEDVATTTPEGTEATTTETTYYRQISKQAMNVARCEASEGKIGCSGELTCIDGENKCSYTYCNETNVPEGESCSNPSQ